MGSAPRLLSLTIQTVEMVGPDYSRKVQAFSGSFWAQAFLGKPDFGADQDCQPDVAVWTGLPRATKGCFKANLNSLYDHTQCVNTYLWSDSDRTVTLQWGETPQEFSLGKKKMCVNDAHWCCIKDNCAMELMFTICCWNGSVLNYNFMALARSLIFQTVN